jgi:hypothetical protein
MLSRICVTVYIKYSECVCSLSYPACKVHMPYYIVICGLSAYTIFFHISRKGYDF